MNRAAVIIAVKKAGTLPELKAALDGAKSMEAWAHRQGLSPVLTITDERGAVTAKAIKVAIKGLVDSDSYEQLFVYFAGHGVNLHYSEYWLLSDAFEDTQESVNVASSVQLAKRCGIPHVVVVSDACRTAPEGIQAQAIRGSEIFPNQVRGGPQKAVDVFYASLLGEPALEIQDQAASASRYQSLYTEELVSALRGERREILTADASDQTKVYLRPQPLKRHLMSAVPRLVAARLGATASHSQTPDAEILSDEFAFLQVFDQALGDTAAPSRRRSAPGRRGRQILVPSAEPVAPLSPTLADVTAEALRQALHAPKGAGGKAVASALRGKVRGTERIAEAVKREAETFLAMHYETGCGFKVRGAAIAAVTAAPRIQVDQLSSELARVHIKRQHATNVLLEFTNGRAVVLPAIRNFIATLTFAGDELCNVSYELSDMSPRWHDYLQQREEVTALRGLIASSVHMGSFRLDSTDAPKLTARIRLTKGLDPTLAIYAAYSYHRLGKPELIRDLETYLVDDLKATLFDIALLADRDPGARISTRVYPPLPMLAQGWSLLGGHNAWTPLLQKLRPHLANSLWTLFDKSAVPLLRKTLKG